MEYKFTQQGEQAKTAQLKLLREANTQKSEYFRMARLALAVFVLMLAVISVTEGMRGPGPKSCCTRFIEKQISKDRVKGYIRTSQQCPTPAVKFMMKGGRHLCARSSEPWVRELISYLDAKSTPGNTSNL